MLLKIQIFLLYAFNAFAGALANLQYTWIKNRLIQYFVWRYPVILEEAEHSNPFDYENFNAFFTRALKTNARPLPTDIRAIISPADGQISQIGTIHKNHILQAKGHHFTVTDLLGGDCALAETFLDGSFLTVYLAPENYHRVHMPIDGDLLKMIYIPGRLLPVNFKTANRTSGLFATNERVVALFQTAIGNMIVVLVGAMIVGSIETVWAGRVTPPRRQSIETWQYPQKISLKRGEELGRFQLGSTVIVLLEKEKALWDPMLVTHHPVRMGETLGMLKPDQS